MLKIVHRKIDHGIQDPVTSDRNRRTLNDWHKQVCDTEFFDWTHRRALRCYFAFYNQTYQHLDFPLPRSLFCAYRPTNKDELHTMAHCLSTLTLGPFKTWELHWVNEHKKKKEPLWKVRARRSCTYFLPMDWVPGVSRRFSTQSATGCRNLLDRQ